MMYDDDEVVDASGHAMAFMLKTCMAPTFLLFMITMDRCKFRICNWQKCKELFTYCIHIFTKTLRVF